MRNESSPTATDQARLHQSEDGADQLEAAFAFLRGVLSENGGSPWATSSADQEGRLLEWASHVGLLLNLGDLPAERLKGGQEHDLLKPLVNGRIWKVTKNGYFGLTPGLELALVPQGEDGRRFHLWESGIYSYLERLTLQNALFGQINKLEGFLSVDGALSVVISQLVYSALPVDQKAIDAWFLSHGFESIASAAYYRRQDNMGIFDAHDKNVIWDGQDFIPFDVIPCRPDGGFLAFIEQTLAENKTITPDRTIRTTDHPSTSRLAPSAA